MFLNIFLLVSLFLNQAGSLPDANTVIARSIAYHDPYNKWNTFQAQLNFIETRPNGKDRSTSIEIDNNNSIFCVSREVEGKQVQRHFVEGLISYTIDKNATTTKEQVKQFKLTDEYSSVLRNYYLYLWGLPMKLKDSGTKITSEIKQVKFNGNITFEVTISYEKEVGSDLWFFYFDPANYAMVGYKFFHENGKGNGEYITLENTENVYGLKIPKARSWYTTQDSTYLGMDTLSSFGILSHDHK